jgi:hypothetical protein
MYLHQQSNKGSILEEAVRPIIDTLGKTPTFEGSPENVAFDKTYDNLFKCAIGISVLHEVRATLENPDAGIPSNVRGSFKRYVKQSVRNAWEPNRVDVLGEVYQMVKGVKKDRPTLSDLYRWWFDV